VAPLVGAAVGVADDELVGAVVGVFVGATVGVGLAVAMAPPENSTKYAFGFATIAGLIESLPVNVTVLPLMVPATLETLSHSVPFKYAM